jgi:hypothetical protein
MTGIENAVHRLKNLSPVDFLNLGQSEFVYVRPTQHDGKTVFAVHGANGDSLFTHETRAGAVVTARQNNLHPLTLQ